METFDLNSSEVYKVLEEKGLKFFYHANTVKTSITFTEHFSLLSRGYVEKNGLGQTPQTSDDNDKKFGIWDYIFLDANDLADYFSRPNVYGPVLFVLTNKLLLDPKIPTVRITKMNPCYWNQEMTINEMYYTNIEDFRQNYMTGNKLQDGATMFIITTLEGKLELNDYFLGYKVDILGMTMTDKQGKEIEYSEAIIRKLKSLISSPQIEKLKFVQRDEWYFKNIYRWKHQSKRFEFDKLFKP